MKKRIIAVIGTVLLTTLFLNGSNTEAVIKPPVIFVGNENVTGGKYIIGQKSKLMLNIKNKKQYKKISFRTKNLKKVKVDQKGTVTAGTSGGKGVIIVTGITKEGKKYSSDIKITVTDTLGKYSNLVDKRTQNEVKKYLIDAGIPKKNAEAWLKDVNEYNKTIKNTSLVKKGYKKLGLNAPIYNDNKIAEYWSKKYNMFIGYNCRITAFDLLKNYIKTGENTKPNTNELFMDSDALKNSPYQKYNKKDTKKFETLYSSINTVSSTNVNKHIGILRKYRSKNNIIFSHDKTKASLITVIFHSYISKNENELFTGHAGVLVPVKNNGYIFIEKISFQSPYQVIKFASKQQLNEYLMRMYDTEWGQNTSKPFIMENNNVLSCYHPVR